MATKKTDFKNIAIVIDDLNGGGAEKVVIELALSMMKLGHRVFVLSLGHHCDYQLPKELKIEQLYSTKQKNITKPWNIKRTVCDTQHWFLQKQNEFGAEFDLILSNLEDSHRVLSRCELTNVYFIVHNALEVEVQLKNKPIFSLKKFFKRVDYDFTGKQLICVSKGIEQQIASSPMTPKSCITIYNPIPINEIKTLAQQENSDIPKAPYIIHVGRVARQKRHDVLFKALAQMPKEYNYPLVLLCNNPKKALKLAKKYGVEERVILPGFQQNPYNWIAQAQLLVLSSDFEGFGMVLAEALALNTYCVSTHCPHGPNEILAEQESHALVPVQDSKALAQAMTCYFTEQPVLKPAKILPQLDVDYVANQYLALIS